jgi:hypothetical protein
MRRRNKREWGAYQRNRRDWMKISTLGKLIKHFGASAGLRGVIKHVNHAYVGHTESNVANRRTECAYARPFRVTQP